MNAISGINPSMISGLGSSPWMEQGQALTDDQKSQLQEIAAKYDPESMTREDVASMMAEIQEAGIRPGEDMKSILEEAGFELQPPQGGAPPKGMGGPGGPPPMGMGGSMGEDSEISDAVQDFVEKAMAGEVTEDDIASFLETIQSQTEDEEDETVLGLIVDQKY